MILDKILFSTSIYFQTIRFGAAFILGMLFTRAVLMPVSGRLFSKRPGKKAEHSAENITGLLGIFVTVVLSLQVGGFGNLLTLVGTIAAAATVAIGFGMRDQVSSVIAGFFLYTDNPFLRGDYIKVNETEGRVKEINLRTTVLNGHNSEKQIVPNSILTTNNVKNFTKAERTKLSLEFKGEASEEFEQKILDIIKEEEEILGRPEPEIVYTGLDDGKPVMQVHSWVKESADYRKIRSNVYRKIAPLIEDKEEE
ncbi:MAG: mechanosensitive ion channel [Nanohaloarchaea archaeon]|nr:mechanosensitive ion channel [Candidatus Nanohaloarchaea archaeon]